MKRVWSRSMTSLVFCFLTHQKILWNPSKVTFVTTDGIQVSPPWRQRDRSFEFSRFRRHVNHPNLRQRNEDRSDMSNWRTNSPRSDTPRKMSLVLLKQIRRLIRSILFDHSKPPTIGQLFFTNNGTTFLVRCAIARNAPLL